MVSSSTTSSITSTSPKLACCAWAGRPIVMANAPSSVTDTVYSPEPPRRAPELRRLICAPAAPSVRRSSFAVPRGCTTSTWPPAPVTGPGDSVRLRFV